ncbi:MAG: ATP-binding protein [Methanosarcina sp.]
MSFWGKLQAKRRESKYRSRKAKEKIEDKVWWDSYCKLISPNRIEVFDTNLVIDQRMYVRCLIVGLPKKNGEGYPRDMTSKAIERIQELSFEGCKVLISHSLIQIPNDAARDSLQKASFTINVNQEHARKVNPGGSMDLALMCKGEDVVANYRQIYFNSQRSFHSSFIIVIMGGEREVFTAESYIISILKSELIEVHIPTGRMLEIFLASLPFPVSDSRSWVEVRSDTAAVLCTSTNLNSRTDEKGLYFGKDLKTNNEILIDLDTLPAKHLTFLGATGAGKTFSFLILLMRMHDMLNSRIVYTTPKADTGTDYRAVADYYGEDACIVDIGPNGSNINPLQILFDKQSMGTSPYAYAKAYDRHKDLFIKFCSVWFGSEFSGNMEPYLDETLNTVYEQAGIYRDRPETWNNPFPVMKNLRELWEKDMNNRGLGVKQKSAEALYNKTYHISEKGSLNYINNQTTDLDLSKDFIIIDLSDVPEIIQDAMNVLVTGMIGSRFSTDNEKETIIAVDEAAIYLRNPELSLSMLKTLTQGRSHKVFLWLATHQPSDFAKNKVKEEYKTNMFINIVLGANLENARGDVRDYFSLTEEETDILTNAEIGEGLLIVKGQRIPIRFEPTALEMSIIKGNYKKRITRADGCFKVFPELQWLVDKQKIIFSDWATGNLSQLVNNGYVKHRVERIGEPGNVVAYLPAGMFDEKGVLISPYSGKQTLDHYTSVVQLAGLLCQYGYEDIRINHEEGVDVEAKIDGKTIAFEYEINEENSVSQLVKKKEISLGKYDIVRFVCSSGDAPLIEKGVGDRYVLKRGPAVREFIEKLALNPIFQENELILSTSKEVRAL